PAPPPDQDRTVGAQTRMPGQRIVVALEQRVVHQGLLELLVQLKRRQLQQPDRLLQLGRQGQVLRKAKLDRSFHAQISASKGAPPAAFTRVTLARMRLRGRSTASPVSGG